MKTKGRPKSTNIEDKRSYFGSESVGNGINWKGNVNSFKMESFKAAREYSKPRPYNSFKK